ncbi:nucleotidyltransferase substrate binding protein [Parabacteroides sp. AD58]|uniref:Nucleotidyltransferase substrate binding protein n=1 Tax=Parabacteroides absconsus TaxID=2951805 RepID=A0ABZ2IQJ8_9BACT|nr:nucleotidyltransferase substrate binding protein [Parabacteroides sp. AD58]MCM6901159.1 nucleotidyltransferase substrate binding protein [Parabacteroides sp. AD58]
MDVDVRWKQRFQNFDKAFKRLTDAIQIIRNDPDNVLLQAGLIQIYEFTFELAWKTLKDYLEMEGFTVPSPRATLRQAFQCGYIQQGDVWLKALNDRNLTAHTYDDEVAKEVIADIQQTYYFLLKDLHQWLMGL